MASTTYDVAVIGSGPAGEKAALEAARLGAKTLVIERLADPGGAGTLSGTIPSKSLRETVIFLERRTFDRYASVRSEPAPMLTVGELMDRKNRVIAARVAEILAGYRKAGVDFLQGRAHFLVPQLLGVESKAGPTQVRAQKTIIAVGTSPYHPPGVDFSCPRILDSDRILELKELPQSLLVYGGGVIGCEYACIFARLGCLVTLVEPRGQVLNFLDSDLSLALVRAMSASGVQFRLGQDFESLKGQTDRVRLTLKTGEVLESQYLLYANGRQGNVQGLGLEQVGIEVNHRNQIEVNENYQTLIPHIYAVGDIIGMPSLVSISNEEGRMAARHSVTGQRGHKITGPYPCAVYTLPEVAMIGPTEEALKQSGKEYKVGIAHYQDLARGEILGVQEGLIKLLFEPSTGKLLAVHILGQQASELIHIGQAVMAFGGTVHYFVEEIFNFPSLSSGYKVAALNGLKALAGAGPT
ncbi:MAG: NAD(P)(+) transhydrogenase [Candidatus Lambdaproteobacteria bacterium RIFOXYD1_FULL_56_27]|uniref:Soluble pyridine nucleotide transhydrogenase n=1 Tax=Candidatus Lambdaproteobacteria bacterium RIFOXYD2_FULL_56_26 TaxID=1817773 RepID=A0A1F6H2T1_9PROT|nr:MAG: NAD(P)(+) transhydrogenase [Candidatus Lambdaproteobacteria bacterium RIFOXYD2_FULL_56_26]OGH05320.1 MAG: NAD(P)(+) transhydrogenase [Candidatus Lambdaproteobacteria bacterium RIFOXYC1_FULL_56_13]OGH09162.1 MAG: NAD(P)(+) transhydrogenase [Candidatus Lambdaproteobacteria bacterium RIFOXYD1_FULL_56_27]